jgi:acetyltransferase-like isoleucine patch superfamily enzyme
VFINTKIHPTAEVSSRAEIGPGTVIWHQAQISSSVKLGKECIVGKGVYIGEGVKIGNKVKIQNYACLYSGSEVEDEVFIGPHVCLTNDKFPRSVTPKGTVKKSSDWQKGKIRLRKGCSIGARSVILPGVTVGEYAMIGAGSVVTKKVGPYSLSYGNPAKARGFVCQCGRQLEGCCPECQMTLKKIKRFRERS